MDVENGEREKPRSSLVERVSESVLIMVKNITTLRGSPWYTANLQWHWREHQSEVEMVAVKPVYQGCKRWWKPGHAW